MKAKPLFFLFVFIHFSYCLAQQPSKHTNVIDSLQTELLRAKNPMLRFKLQVKLGIAQNIMRFGFWDSLANSAHQLNLKLEECQFINRIGELYAYQNNPKALTQYRLSLAISQKYNYVHEILNTKKNIAFFYFDYAHNLDSSLAICYKGLHLAEQYKDTTIIVDFNLLIARIYFFSGDFKKSLNQHLYVLNAIRKTENTRALVSILVDIGSDYSQLNDTANTIYYYMQTAKYEPELGKTPDAAEVCKVIGTVFDMRKQFSYAEKYYGKAVAIYEFLNSKAGVSSALICQSNSNFKLGRIHLAKQQALTALELSNATNFFTLIPQIQLTLKNIYLKEKDYKRALEMYERYVIGKDSLSNEKSQKLALQKQYDYEVEKRENQNKLLAQQNQIQSLKLNQNRNGLIAMGCLFILVLLIVYLFSRQTKLKTEQKSTRLEQKLLLSQMNPHFIFNSLQAIQNYILKHEGKEAVKYLSSFATVTRSVLENSRLEYISLKSELNLLQNYLQLQKLRFKNRFEYEIKLEETIEPEYIFIPPMLLQPFIENAVEHGFQFIENDGKLLINYTLKNNTLFVEVIDNGSGIKVESLKTKNHQSLALEITKERISLMNKKEKQKMVFSTNEAFPNEGIRKGFKVSFTIPLKF